MFVFKPPSSASLLGKGTKVFLAGAIDQGQAVNWQQRATDALQDLDIALMNPRRDYWDPTWDQSPNNPDFIGQVRWEMSGLHTSDYQLFAFPKDAKAPISFYEFGKFATPNSAVVWLEPGFYRSGNVQLYCQYNTWSEQWGPSIACVPDFDEAIRILRNKITTDKYYKMRAKAKAEQNGSNK